jgi:hypothetical protein
MSFLRAALPGMLVVLAGGCQLQTTYEGQFSCSAPPYSCPGDLVCQGGLCVDPSAPPPDRADAAPGTPDAEADADVETSSADAGVTTPDATTAAPPTPDAALPPPPVVVDVTFGERTGADVQNVTIDATMREDSPNQNNGGGSIVAVDAQPRTRGLLQFNLTSVAPTLHCQEATLAIHVNDPIESGEYQIFAVDESWTEGEVTWNNRRNGSSWHDSGAGPGSRANSPMATGAPRSIGEATFALDCATIDAWIQDPSSNHGMVWISTSPDGRGGEWNSSENGDGTTRPLLTLRLAP